MRSQQEVRWLLCARWIRPWATALLLTTGVSTAWAESPTETKPAAVPGATKSAAGFYHPGVLVNRPQLDFIKAKVAAGVEPWKSAYEAAKASDLGALTYVPHPWKACECGPYSRPDIGCKDEQRDSEAAYTQALLWFISGNDAYAKNAVAIMNAWSSTLKGGHTTRTGPFKQLGAPSNGRERRKLYVIPMTAGARPTWRNSRTC